MNRCPAFSGDSFSPFIQLSRRSLNFIIAIFILLRLLGLSLIVLGSLLRLVLLVGLLLGCLLSVLVRLLALFSPSSLSFFFNWCFLVFLDDDAAGLPLGFEAFDLAAVGLTGLILLSLGSVSTIASCGSSFSPSRAFLSSWGSSAVVEAFFNLRLLGLSEEASAARAPSSVRDR